MPQYAMRKAREIGRLAAPFRGRPAGRGRGSSMGTLTRSSDTLTDRASAGTSKASIKTSSMSWWSATANAPTRWATRSKLDRK